MTMNPLPPQAYTKETLLKAYQWMQAQPPSIREMAMTPDILVSLYLKASRDGDQSLDRPSIQNFKTELKNLAGLMGELDSPKQGGAQTGSNSGPMPSRMSANSILNSAVAAQSAHQAPPPPRNASGTGAPSANAEASPQPPRQTLAPPPGWNEDFEESAQMFHAQQAAGTTVASPNGNYALHTLDAKSFDMLKEIKNEYNLSSEAEALRMLIKIGYTKAKGLLK